jgi:hypothetical protein
LIRITDHIRPGCGDHTWSQIKAGGLAKLIDDDLRQRLETFYAETLPRYETAWQSCYGRISEFRREWDGGFGRPPSGNMLDINWFTFLVARECNPPRVELGTGDVLRVLRIFNYGISSNMFRDWMPVEQFLTERWNEAAHDPAIVEYVESRDRAIRESKLLIKSLQVKIRI